MHFNNADEFIGYNIAAIDKIVVDIKKAKESANPPQKVSYLDIKSITGPLRSLYRNPIGYVPSEIERACVYADMALAPPSEKLKLIKNTLSVMTGTAAIGLIIYGTLIALGSGMGIFVSIMSFFSGALVLGPIGLVWILGGVGLLAIALFFFFKKDDEQAWEGVVTTLKQKLQKLIPPVWKPHQQKFQAYDFPII
ncbi:MAG: hypothetical protein LBT38_01990 [Deltaproteobacteria bacterium]|jgi:hypothetical protein|nr:hypothetical protein [Deltaproteobacteria bacterium]